MAALMGIVNSGCALIPQRIVTLGGISDVIQVDKGAKVCGVSLPTDEKNADGTPKLYCIVAKEEMRLYTMNAVNIMEKYRK